MAILYASGVHRDAHWQTLGVHESVQLPAFQL